MRQDKTRTLRNKKLRELYKKLIKKAKQVRTAESVDAAFKQIDKAAKNKLIHENKAARLKSALSKSLSGEVPAKPATKKTEKKKTKSKVTPKKSPAKVKKS